MTSQQKPATGREIRLEELRAEEGCYIGIEEDSSITTATLSPDATALALGTSSGWAKFYILENFEDIKCAYKWKPHGGKSIDSLCFLDNLVDSLPSDQFWKYALSTADGNRELALWNCENWKKLGTLQIKTHSSKMDGWGLSVEVDWTGRFLFLSDIERKSFYIIELKVDEGGLIRFMSFADFPMSQPILDTAVIRVEKRQLRSFSPAGAGLIDNESPPPPFIDADEEDSTQLGIRTQLLAVFPRSLQELDVRFDSNVENIEESSETGKSEKEEKQDWNGDVNTNVESAPSEDNAVESSAQHERVSPTAEEVSKIMKEEEEEVGVVFPRPITPLARVLEEEDRAEEAAAARNRRRDSGGGDEDDEDEVEQENVQKSAECHEASVRMEDVRNLFEEGQGEICGRMGALAESVESQRERLEELARIVNGVSESLRENSERLKPEAINLVIQDAAQRSVSHAVKSELKGVIGPYVADTMRSVKSEMVEKIDAAVKEHTGKLLKSKALSDSIANSVSDILVTEIQNSYKECFQKIIVPSYDQSTRTLFSQMNDLFSKGVKDYMQELNKQSIAKEAVYEECKNQVLNHLTNVTDQMRAMMERHINSLTNSLQSHMDKQIVKVSEKLEGSVVSSVRTLVREEMTRAMSVSQSAEVGRSSRSVAATPVPVQDRTFLQQELMGFIKEGDFNGAFKKALSACNLPVLLYVCGKADVKVIFGGKECLLEMPVILSLLQQLSVDFSGNTELKLKYVQEGVLALADIGIVETHLANIIDQIQRNLRSYQTHNPNSPYSKMVKMILMSSSALIGRETR